MEGYTNVSRLGWGTYGTVYLVRRNRDGKEFARKEVYLDRFGATEIERAVNEFRILQQLNHENIVQYIDSGRTETELRIVTEYCAGRDLDTWLKCQSDHRLPASLVLPLAVSMLEALKYLQQKRVIHRDIKPANIVVTAAGVPKLTDFGCSYAASTTRRANATLACTFIGTISFMAPEIFTLEEEALEAADIDRGYTHKVDVWSLGATLFTLLNRGKFLFETKGAFKKALSQPSLWRVPDLPPDTLPEAVKLVSEMLVLDPEARPSAEKLLALGLFDGVVPISKTSDIFLPVTPPPASSSPSSLGVTQASRSLRVIVGTDALNLIIAGVIAGAALSYLLYSIYPSTRVRETSKIIGGGLWRFMGYGYL